MSKESRFRDFQYKDILTNIAEIDRGAFSSFALDTEPFLKELRVRVPWKKTVLFPVLLGMLSACGRAEAEISPLEVPKPTKLPTATTALTPSPEVLPITVEKEPEEATATATPSPRPTMRTTATEKPSPTATATPSPTETTTPTPTEPPTRTPTPEPTATFTPTPESTPTPEVILSKPFDKIAVPNVFDLPGWVRPGVVITKDGFLVADSIEGAFGTFVDNETKGLAVEGDFEVQWKMVTTVKGDPKTRSFGLVHFNNRPSREATAQLELGINEDNKLFFGFSDRKARKGKDLLDGARINAPDTGDLRVRFVGVNTGSPEKVLILNGESGEKLAEAELPLPLFSTGELFFSLWIVNTKEDPRGVQMNISPMKILVPAESQNIKLR